MTVPVQNTTHAVMAQRHEPRDSLDDFPTPPWATRALLEHVLDKADLKRQTVLEPACGRGHMAETLKEYFGTVIASDIFDYHKGYPVKDFLTEREQDFERVDWVITNPPFRRAPQFIHRALRICNSGVAVLVRTVFVEGVRRYVSLYSKVPPAVIAPFSERVPIIKGRVDPHASSATSYSWLVWDRSDLFCRDRAAPMLTWIPPCRRKLEKESDYAGT